MISLMKIKLPLTELLSSITLILVVSKSVTAIIAFKHKSSLNHPVSCEAQKQQYVMKTIFGFDGEGSFNIDTIKLNPKVSLSIDNGLTWIAATQSAEGGWGAGMHLRQDV